MSIRFRVALIIFIFALFIVIFTFSLIRNFILYELIFKDFKETMKKGIEIAKLIPEYTDVNKIKELANNWEEYKKIVDQTNRIAKIFGFIYLYIMEPKDDNFIFLMSNEFDYELFKKDYLSVYDYPPKELVEAYKTKQATFTRKPYTDEYGTFVSYFEPLLNDQGEVYAIIGVDYDVSFYVKILSKMYWRLLAVIIFVFIMDIILIIYVEKKIIAPINKISDHTKIIADGNLRKINIKIKKDEIGKLSNSVNIMVDNLINIINGLKNITERLNNISYKNNSLMSNFLESINSQASSLEEISSAIEEATSSIKMISENAKESSEKIIEGSKKAIDATKYIDSIVDSISKIFDYSKKIRKSIELIYEITDETHILALNASIEASKAGEVGIGFAVVAQEIRNLAEKAENTVSEIEKIIKENEKIVEESLESIKSSKEKLKSILELNVSSSNVLKEIKESISEQANVNEELSKAVEDINQTTQKFLESSEILGRIAKDILSTSKKIDESIKNFKID
ncbi:MAG: methyl-accepting chemotaxis protein [Spirochaetes bacterium]|nr:methyl-accepting chemotaxis protein [Spirochaetota bacterium]